MNTTLKRLGTIVLACFTLMSFRLEPEATNTDRLLYDVRGAFVAARPDVAPALMQSIHAQVQNAIKNHGAWRNPAARGTDHPSRIRYTRPVPVRGKGVSQGHRPRRRRCDGRGDRGSQIYRHCRQLRQSVDRAGTCLWRRRTRDPRIQAQPARPDNAGDGIVSISGTQKARA
ncbi:hypothetical protein AGR7A_Cc200191 [Agrobacterium deltaense NCPPB 1641]|uniref:Uncharacterized protein n=1 Tax=Agrobacterium deltaense NCPPB 1641 TaxID=1183425 RepID=A0A1S7TL54_9HYPH|nr:hypothetical protein AGR7A_Cc200191 [Agrobacterium deltaense NCPPB 1641]